MNKLLILIFLPLALLAEKQKGFTVELQELGKDKQVQKFQEALTELNKGSISTEEYQKIADEYFLSLENKKGSGYKPYLRAKHKYGGKNASESQPDFNKIINEFKAFQAKQDPFKLQEAGEWIEMGPFESPDTRGGTPSILGTGRMNSIEVDPNNSDILWAGAAGGGIWKSTDRGQSWRTYEETNFASLGISDIAIAKSNSNIVYAASGDKNAWFSGGADVRYYSAGLYKTVNGGNSWEVVSPFSNNNTSLRNNINDVEVDPTNPNLVYAATSEGLYRSDNGGSSWDRLVTGNIMDMKINLGDRDRLHLSRWTGNANEIITYDNSSESVISTFPVNGGTRGEIALTEADPDRVYVLVSAFSVFGAIIRSDNAGENWQVTVTRNDGVNYMGYFDGTGGDFNQGQGLYDLCIAVNPNNEDDVVIGGINLWRSNNGANSFNRITSWWQWNANPPFIHADQHELEWDSNGDLFSANDGGIYLTTDNGTTWGDLNTGLHVTQFYRFSSSQQNDQLMVGGSQDNSTWVYEDGEWIDVLMGGDGFHCLVDPTNDQIMMASQNNNGIQGTIGTLVRVSNNSGRSFNQFVASSQFNEFSQWIAPFELDPTNTEKLYLGFNNIYRITNYDLNSVERLTNNSVAQNQTIRQIAISPVDGRNIWYSIGGRCYYSSDNGQNWDLIYNGNLVITDIEASVEVANEAYFTLTGFSDGRKVIKTRGTNTENISFNLPNISAYSIVHIETTDELYVGMDIGVYKKSENGNSWELFSKGLTRSGISELEFQKSSQKLRASTYGRGIWEVPVVNCEIVRPEILANDEPGDIAVCEGEEVELRYLGDYDRVEWNTGELKRSITVTEPGEYFVTAENNDGCFSISETINVDFDEIPVVNLTKTGVVQVCEGDSVLVTVAGIFDEYEWSNGLTQRNFWAKEAGEYFLTVRQGDALCEGVSDIFTVEVISAPTKPEINIEDETLKITDNGDSYQWFRNDEPIEEATGLEFTPTFNGTYYVVATNSNDCEIASSEVSVNWLSIAEAQKRGFSVSPNPTDGLITIDYAGLEIGNARLEIVNSVGQVVISEDFFANSKQLNKSFDLEKFPSGVYYISLWNKGIRVTEKIILK